MNKKVWLRLLLLGIVWLSLLAAPGVTLPGGELLGFVGAAAAQQQVNIDDFYDALDPFGQWVWHPRFGYVWLPENVSQNWRPYTVGHWEYTDEYGWYWDSREPFAWAVYHYGRWGYDDDYGWFWVPGDTWAPAWVQWRYSDDYVGWAPIGPRRGGYAYGEPVNYDPPVAESWVFVQPQYMTSRAISHYAVPIAGLGAVFIGATNVYRPQFRGGVVYNYGMPRDRVVQIIKRPIYVQKIYKVDNWKNGGFDKGDGHGRGIKIYAPGVDKDSKPERGPKRFADQPNDFKPKAKLKDTYKGDLPKGFGQSAKDMKSVVREEGPDAFNKKHGRFAPDDQADRSGNDKDNDQNARGDGQGGQGKAKGFGGQGAPNDQNAKGGNDQGNQGKPKNFGGQGGPDQFKQGNRDQGDQGGGGQGKPKNFGSQGGPDQFKQGNRDQGDQGGGGQGKPKNFGSQGGPDQFKQGNRDLGDQGGGGQGKNKNFGSQSGPNDQNAKGSDDQGNQGKPKNFGGPNGQGGPNQFQGGPNQFKQGNRDNNDQGGGGQGKPKNFGGQGGPDQFKQGNRDLGDQGGGQGKPKNFGSQGGPDQFKQGNRDQGDQGGGGQGKNKNFGGPGGPGGPNQFQGGPNQFKQGNRNQDDQGGGGQGKPKNFGGPGGPIGPGGGGQAQGQGGQGGGGGDKKDKCQRHPEKPECQN